MTVDQQIAAEMGRVKHILATVPFMPGTKIRDPYLSTYILSYADIKQLNLTEQTWCQYEQIPANKLLKLAISFGNVVEAFRIENSAAEAHAARLKTARKVSGAESFKEGLSPKPTQLPAHYTNLARKIALILKNFEVGVPGLPTKALLRHVSHLSVYSREDDTATVNGSVSLERAEPPSRSPIRLNSRQMFVEKFEINIRLDALLTMKIVLMLLVKIFGIFEQSCKDHDMTDDELAPPMPFYCASSVFSSSSGASEITPSEYALLIQSIICHINSGIIGPFTSLLQLKVIEPRVIAGFQNLLSTMQL